MVAAACFSLSLAQRVMNRPARELRRDPLTVSGRIELRDGRVEAITIPYLLDVPEKSLRLVGLSVTLLAVGWLVARM